MVVMRLVPWALSIKCILSMAAAKCITHKNNIFLKSIFIMVAVSNFCGFPELPEVETWATMLRLC